MALATGKSADALTLKLGKALQDPAAGLSKLAQLGISFTEQTKEQIKTLEAHGRTLEAQKIVLGAVEERYRGAAAAAGQTLPGQLAIAHQAFNDLAGDLVGRMVPAIQEAIGWLKDHWSEINAAIQGFWSQAQPILIGLGELFGSVVDVVRDHWSQIEPIVQGVAKIVQDVAKIIAGALKLVVDLLHGDWSKAWQDAKQIVGAALNAIKTLIATETHVLAALASALGSAILSGIKSGVGELVGWVSGLLGRVAGAISNAAGSVGAAATSLGNAFLRGISSGLSAIGAAIDKYVRGPINALIDHWNALEIPRIDIHFPLPFGKSFDVGAGPFALPDIPHLDTGGFVIGTGVAVVHKGERVLPAGRAGAGNTYLNVTVPGLIGSRQELAVAIVRLLQQHADIGPSGRPYRTY
jgi:hypothetical protein